MLYTCWGRYIFYNIPPLHCSSAEYVSSEHSLGGRTCDVKQFHCRMCCKTLRSVIKVSPCLQRTPVIWALSGYNNQERPLPWQCLISPIEAILWMWESRSANCFPAESWPCSQMFSCSKPTWFQWIGIQPCRSLTDNKPSFKTGEYGDINMQVSGSPGLWLGNTELRESII